MQDLEDLHTENDRDNIHETITAENISELAKSPSEFIKLAKTKLDSFMMEDPDIKQRCDKINHLKSL